MEFVIDNPRPNNEQKNVKIKKVMTLLASYLMHNNFVLCYINFHIL